MCCEDKEQLYGDGRQYRDPHEIDRRKYRPVVG